MNLTLAWIYLLVASVMEVFWLICLKYLHFKEIVKIDWKEFFSDSYGIKTLLPLIGYIGFGLGNVVFFSIATKSIPLSNAFAVWLGVALVATTLIDVLLFKEQLKLLHYLFLLLILVGVLGLKTIK
jgi:quaternary ammonium compound-resistance protein SugE